jgi:hypothetical protein
MNAFRKFSAFTLLAALAAGSVPAARAGVTLTAARELAEAILRKATGRAAAEATEALARKITTSAAKYGDDLVTLAVKKGGPRALSLADEAAEASPALGKAALRFVGRHGDEGAALLTKGAAMKVLSLGDEAAEMLIKHKGVAAPLVESLGEPAAKALAAVGPRNGRRLAMLSQGGELAAMGRSEELMGVVARFGDGACDFVWRNKKGLAAAGVMAAFLRDPGPFIDGTKELSETVVEKAVAPVAQGAVAGGVQLAGEIVEPMAREAAASMPWAWIFAAGAAAVSIGVAVRLGSKPEAS